MDSSLWNSCMDLHECNQLLVFGGSFDPPHLAHVTLPMYVLEQLGADLAAFVPAARSPHKSVVTATAIDRLAMLRLALHDQDRAIVVTDEIDRAIMGQPSYTVDTLEALRSRLRPQTTMRLLIGTDQVRAFDRWRSPHRVIELAEPVVMLRPPDTAQALLKSLENPGPWEARLLTVPSMEISSSEIRGRLACGEPVNDLLDPAVTRYITQHRLYY